MELAHYLRGESFLENGLISLLFLNVLLIDLKAKGAHPSWVDPDPWDRPTTQLASANGPIHWQMMHSGAQTSLNFKNLVGIVYLHGDG